MKFTVEICVAIGLFLAFVRPKWLLYFLIFSLLEPSRSLSLGNYVILGTVNVKFYEITISLIYFGALWNQKRSIKDCLPVSLIVFIFFALVSLWRGNSIYGESAFNQFRTFYSLGMCVVIPLMFKKTSELRPVTIFFFALAIVMGTIEFLGVMGFDQASHWAMSGNRFTSLLSASQGAVLAMPYIFILSTMRYITKLKIIAIIGGMYCFALAVITGSRGVSLGLIGSTVCLALLMPLRKKIAVTIIIVLLGVSSFIFAKAFYIERYGMTLAERFDDIISMSEGTARWRLDAWNQMFEDIREKPLLGSPFGTPSTFYVSYVGRDEKAPHNEYLKIARYTGLLGFAAFMWFMLQIFMSGFKSLKKYGETKEYYELAGYIMCLLFHVITATFTQAFTTMDRSPVVWALAGIIILYTLTNNSDKGITKNYA
ncbi:O-antigen ligase family protein [bacterium]|nr:O-antigen ligase family protein [bacterium]